MPDRLAAPRVALETMGYPRLSGPAGSLIQFASPRIDAVGRESFSPERHQLVLSYANC
jgi:hypothetical protein